MIDEGYIKFESRWRRTAPLACPETGELIRWRQVLYDAGLIGFDRSAGVGYGNLSIRSGPQNRFLITGTATGHLPEIGEEHIALVKRVDRAANRVWCEGACEASSESLTHAALYPLAPTINAVAHGHDLVAWQELTGSLPTTSHDVAYGTPGMASELARLYEETGFRTGGVAVMGGHREGMLAFGRNLAEACERLLAACGGVRRRQG